MIQNTSLSPIRSVIEEMQKVAWPTRKETVKLTVVVLSVSIGVGLYIGLLDVMFAQALQFIAR